MNINEYALDDDIVAIATALSPAAISVIRCSGKNTFKKLSSIFSRPKKLLASKGNELIYGWILSDKKKLDEVILCTYRSPKSFTGEDCIEVMCHGGLCITMKVLQAIISSGFRQAQAGEFTFRSFVFGKKDLTQAEATKEIIDAKTSAVAESAGKRLQGRLYKKLEDAKKLILRQIAEIDVHIEYPEDESDSPEKINIEKLSEAKEILESTIQNWSMQKIFNDGAKLVLAGKPNAGKSQLFNALINEERAIVSNIAGTTRDWLETEINFHGLPVKLYDTAGLRISKEHIEKIGIDKTKILIAEANLIMYLLDSTTVLDKREFCKEDLEFLSEEKYSHIKKFLILTKLDLLSAEEQANIEHEAKSLMNKKRVDAFTFVSAKEHVGLEDLIDTAYSLLLTEDFKSENISVGTERQKNACEKAIGFLKHAIEAVKINMPSDAIVLDLEEALRYIGEITGEVKSDDILGEIFSGFCVGK